MGLLVAVVYWAMLAAGQTLGSRVEGFSPFWAMWLPDFFVLLSGAVAFMAGRLTGGGG